MTGHIEILLSVIPCSVVVGYQCFGGLWKMQAELSSETLVSSLHGVPALRTST
jgi:hypothetical protein